MLENVEILLLIETKHKKVLEIFLENKTNPQLSKKIISKQTKKAYREKVVKIKCKNLCERYI